MLHLLLLDPFPPSPLRLRIACQTHEADVTVGGEVRMAGEELVEVSPGFVEGEDTSNRIITGDEPDNQKGPQEST